MKELEKHIFKNKEYSLEDFIEEFSKFDINKVWEKDEIVKLYDLLKEFYGVINEENFNVGYCINNKDKVDY